MPPKTAANRKNISYFSGRMATESTKEKIILPPKYYLDYFKYLLSFVETQYAHVLGDPEHAFLAAFYDLSEQAQLLFLRFSNRKGPLYRLSKINYEEIPKVREAATELQNTGFITDQIPNVPETFNLFTRQELYQLFKDLLHDHKGAKKIEWLEILIEGDEAHQRLIESETIIQVGKEQEFEFFKLLFFGSYKTQMTEFVIRDVGNVKLERLDDNKFSPWCNSREEARAFFEISEIKSFIRKALRENPAVALHENLTEIPWHRFQQYPHAAKALGRICLELGQQLEREDAKETALFYYQLTEMPPSRERQVRVLDSLEQTNQATNLAENMLETYFNATERIFAKDFLNRPKIRINRSMTAKLDGSEVVILTPESNKRVEQLAIEHFENQGFRAIHSENFIWRNLFGLLFWEELFDQSGDSFHHPLQRIPADIYAGFYQKRKSRLLATCKKLNTRKSLSNKINRTIGEKAGIANPFVYWYPDIGFHLDQVIQCLRPAQLTRVLLEIAKNPKDNSKGFPDLFVWKDREYHFYEIKSPNDHLSAQQLFWIDFMQELKMEADILRIAYGTN